MSTIPPSNEATFVVIGGGIAGVTCAETLAFYQPEQSILLITEYSIVKTVTNLHAITQTLTNFNIEEKHMNYLTEKYNNVQVLNDTLSEIISDEECSIRTTSNKIIKYKYLCLCTGAAPKLIPQAINNPYVIGIRDTDSVNEFLKRISVSKRVVIVGNGGIASELAYKIQNTKIDWVIKDKHITATFIDPGAAEFVKDRLVQPACTEQGPSKRMRYEYDDAKKSGAALGPDWYKHLNIRGNLSEFLPESVSIHYESEVTDILIHETNGNSYPVEVILSNGEVLHTNFVVSATGVEPRLNSIKLPTNLLLSNDGGVKVNEFMQSSIANIYAAGDVCTPSWEYAKQWFPMKLWTQARQMGCYAAKSMSASFASEQILQDFCFELFTHTTQLFGYKVILLGLYNGQKLNNDYEILFRMTKGVEYIKFVLHDNRLQGAVLIGETDLEEMCENLILNQIDVSPYKEDLLNPNVDIEDYFD